MVLEEELQPDIHTEERTPHRSDAPKSLSVDMSGLSVMICMPTHRDLPVPTAMSLIETLFALQKTSIGIEIQVQYGSSLVQAARSRAAHLFLKSKHNRLFWIDSDMVWKPDSFFRILALSTKLDVVGASYRAKQDPPIFMVSQDKPNHRVEYTEFGCIPMDGFGLGFACIQRHVIEQLAAKAPLLRTADHDIKEPMRFIFHCGERNGSFRGEDMEFFADCKALGYQPYLDPSIRLGHVGPKTYEGSFDEWMIPDNKENN